MKKTIFSLMIGAIVALASCSKSEEAPMLPQEGEQITTFNIEAPATRDAVTGLTRYIVEAYEGKDLTTTPVRVEAATGSLTLALKMNTDYTFVFWADRGIAKTESTPSSGYWNTDNLQEVIVSAGKESTISEVAYCLAVSFNSNDFEANKAVTLKNATAKINFVETAGLLAANNTLVVKYSNSGKLNVATGAITEVAGEVIRTYSNIAQTGQDGIVASDYILAPLDEKRLLDLMMTFNSEPEKAITAVPFQQSYKTNVKGEFSNFYASVFTVSNTVDDYTNNPDVEFSEKVKVGDFYYSDKTFSTTLDNTKTCIGIVYVVNTDGETGKIVSLDESTSIEWSTENIVTGATSDTDGAGNTARVFTSVSYTAAKYPAFAWCATKNTTALAGISWYIPAKEELKALYGKYTDGTDDNVDAGVMTIVNASLSRVNGAELLNDFYYYWSSTEDSDANVWVVNFESGGSFTDDKDINSLNGVRVVSAF